LHRLIAAVLISEGKVVQTRHFKITNVVGDVKTAVKFFAAWDVDELILIDISPQPWSGMKDCVADVMKRIFIPVTVGGHISNLEQIRDLTLCGADRVLIRSAAWKRPEFITEVAERYGSQFVVAGHDWIALDGLDRSELYRAREWNIQFAQKLESLGAGEILLNVMARDGTKNGYDLKAISETSNAVRVPVVAMGGAGKAEHFAEAIKAGADAVAAGNLFHYSEHATVKAKEAMIQAGLPVRKATFAVL
jgi:cyclase